MEEAVTVVIPVYNRAHLIERTLDSVVSGELPRRLVIVDNASTDNTVEVVGQWVRRHAGQLDIKVVTERAPGAANARNRGLQEVETPWVMFFDSDDVMTAEHIGQAMAFAAEHPQARIIGWPVTLHYLDGREGTLPFYPSDAIYHCIMHGTMATQRYMARTDLVREVGGWNPEMTVFDDIELGSRLLAAKPVVKRIKVSKPPVDVYAQRQSITGENFADREAPIERALASIEANVPRYAAAVNLRRALLAGVYRREGHQQLAVTTLRRALESMPTHSRCRRALMRLACWYTARGGRGAAYILKPFFNPRRL